MTKLLLMTDVLNLIEYIYNLKYPQSEKFGLESQIKRASVSVSLNLREGNIFQGKNKIRFFKIALGSLVEVDQCLLISKRLGFCSEDYYINFKQAHFFLCYNKLNRLIHSISSIPPQTPQTPHSEARVKCEP